MLKLSIQMITHVNVNEFGANNAGFVTFDVDWSGECKTCDRAWLLGHASSHQTGI